MKPKEMFNRILKNILYLLCGGVAGVLLLLLVFQLPTNKMYTHVYQSLPTLGKEFTEGIVVDGYQASLTGNFTDCLMLFYSIYENPEHSTLEQVMHMYRTESTVSDGWAPGESLRDYCNGVVQDKELSYGRYWHGYLVLLKPLLMITNLSSIRMIMSVTQLLLVGIIIYAATKRGIGNLAIAFLASVPFFYFVSMFTSLSLSICFYIMAAAVLIVLCGHEKLKEKNRYLYFFLLVGMATAYLDFLTYPLVTLAFPLIVVLYLDKEVWKTKVQKLFSYSIQWGIGYIGLWALKWIFSDVLTGSSIIADAVGTVFERTGTAGGGNKLVGLFTVLARNLEVYFNWSFYILALFVIIFLAFHLIKNKCWKPDFNTIKEKMVILGISLYPIIWYFLTQNHAEEHYMFTCKNVAIIVFAVLCAVTYDKDTK